MSSLSNTTAPARRLVDARDHVEERRLPGTVRADEAHDGASLDREVDVVDGDEASELLAQRLDLEQELGHPYSSGPPRTSINDSS